MSLNSATESRVSPSLVREVFRYDPATGILTTKRSSGPRKAGKPAGYRRRDGYLRASIGGHLILVHRLAWCHFYGEWPHSFLDHVNGARADNRIENLRGASKAQNGANRAINSNNSSGFKGVSWHKRPAKWACSIRTVAGKKHLGYFDDPAIAHEAYRQAAERTFGEFARSE